MLILEQLTLESLDAVLSLPPEDKIKYFEKLITTYYPNIEDTDTYESVFQHYVSSFYLERLYRGNVWLNKFFIPIYTSTGLIKNLVAKSYYTDFETKIQ